MRRLPAAKNARKSEPLLGLRHGGPTPSPSQPRRRTSGRQLRKRPVWPGPGAGPTSGLPRASDLGRAAIARTRRPRGTDTRAGVHAKLAAGGVRCMLYKQRNRLCLSGRSRLAAERKSEAVKVRSASHFSPPLVSLSLPRVPPHPSLSPPKTPVPPRSRPVRFVDRVLLECRIGASRCLLCCWCAARPLLLVALDALRFCLRAFFSLTIWMHFSGVSRLFDRAACSGRSNPCFACCCLVMVRWYFFSVGGGGRRAPISHGDLCSPVLLGFACAGV